MKRKNTKNIILSVLIVLAVIMTIAYSALSSRLKINGTSNITSDFNVVFTNIIEGTMNDSETIDKSFSGTSATFQVDLKKPGSSAEYIVTVENLGKIDATLESIEGITEANGKAPTYITFSLEDIKEGDSLSVDETKTFKVKVTYDESATEIPEETKQLSLKLNYVQKTNSGSGGSGETISKVANTLLESSDATYNYIDGTYLKGSQSTNYVWFNGFMWRIMGVNADGSVRLITEENVTAIPWGAEGTGENYDASYANDWLNNYFYPKLKNKEYLVKQTWCSEKTTDTASARTTCENNLSTTPQYVGLVSIDEFNLSNDTSSYLINSQIYYTSTVHSSTDTFMILMNIGIVNDSIVNNTSGIRPVINLLSNTTIDSGTGTLVDPYIIKNTNSGTGTLKDNSLIGEYVTYAGRNYRVVETSSSGTKLILDGYYDANNDGTIETSDQMAYNDQNENGNCLLCTTINEDGFINWLSNNNDSDKQKLVSTTWYRGDAFSSGSNYKNNLESLNNPYEGRVGLIRIGEMLSGQSETIISKNHTSVNDNNNSNYYWSSTYNENSSSSKTYNPWLILDGYANTTNATNKNAIRPVINIGANVQILSGNGTPNSPYQI